MDSVLNVLDIVTMVNYILGGTEFSELQFSLGDVNGDNLINVLDLVDFTQCILNHTCSECHDINYDGNVNIMDIILVVNSILEE